MCLILVFKECWVWEKKLMFGIVDVVVKKLFEWYINIHVINKFISLILTYIYVYILTTFIILGTGVKNNVGVSRSTRNG